MLATESSLSEVSKFLARNNVPDPENFIQDWIRKSVEIRLTLGASPSEVLEFASDYSIADPEAFVQAIVSRWVVEDRVMGSGRIAVQRRRLQRQVRIAMDGEKIGDAVRAETILARLDDQETDAEANRVVDEFDLKIRNLSKEEMEYFIAHGEWLQDESPVEETEENNSEEIH